MASAAAWQRAQVASSSSAGVREDANASRREPVQRRNRLSRSRDFDAVYGRGRSVSTRFLTLYWFEREEALGEPRLGFAVPKSVGNAVVRNRIKRQLREIMRGRLAEVAAANDYVLIVRSGLPEAAETNGHEWLEQRVDELLGKAAA
jgi:ribonuclease P protein component